MTNVVHWSLDPRERNPTTSGLFIKPIFFFKKEIKVQLIYYEKLPTWGEKLNVCS